MQTFDRQTHWQTVYTTKGENEVSWFEENPAISLALLDAAGITTESAVIDIGGGASRLVDELIARGLRNVTVLDLSEAALQTAKDRLGHRAKDVNWIVDDVTAWKPSGQFDIWHDRAAFHFLTEEKDRQAYVDRLKAALRAGGQAIIGTFSLEGPEKCSGLPIVRYDARSLTAVLGPSFELIESRKIEHQTPWGSVQKFQFGRFIRLP
jgi:2-polyprenyl-3-methyl-5-hydroxy-6-metoxy-1,4-benzoquinol methylase